MDDINSLDTLIYIVAILAALVLPVFKSIREARQRSSGPPRPQPAGGDERGASSSPPRVEYRPSSEVPEPVLGVKPLEAQRESAAKAPSEPPHQTYERASDDPQPHGYVSQLGEGYRGIETTLKPSSVEDESGRAARRRAAARAPGASASSSLARLLADRDSIRGAIVLKEILDQPLGLRGGGALALRSRS